MSVPRRQALADAESSLARAMGVRDEAATRLLQLGTEVSAAKGFLVLRPDIEGTLEEFQEAIHRRTVGSYETLLTSLIGEVIGDGSEVRLELSSERGSPCLDIFVERDGHRLNIMRGQGGAVANVVSMGLRLIATLRSGTRPILVLDEVDCWVESWRIGDFYRVLAQLSGTMGLQVLAISHHPPGLLKDANPRLFVVEGDPYSPQGVGVRIERQGAEWRDEAQQGMRRIVLQDFAGYRDCCFDLGPGLNVISGSNNVGKSRVPMALRSACYGEGSAEDVRVGQGGALVRMEMEGGESVEWTRQEKRNPVSLWRRLAPDGGVLATQGGRNPPLWVDTVCGIAPRGGLDVQIGRQLFPVFLLGETGAVRASVLNIGRESGLLQDMMRLQKADVEASTAVVRRGEREISALDARLRSMAGLDEAAAALREAHDALSALDASETARVRMLSSAAAIEACRKSLSRASARADAVSAEAVGEPPALRDCRPLSALLQRMELTGGQLRRSRACEAALQAMPEPPAPTAEPRYAAPRGGASRLEAGHAALAVARLRLAAVEGVEEPKAAMSATVDSRRDMARFIALSEARDAARGSLAEADRLLAEAEASWDASHAGKPCPSCGAMLHKGGIHAGGHSHAA